MFANLIILRTEDCIQSLSFTVGLVQTRSAPPLRSYAQLGTALCDESCTQMVLGITDVARGPEKGMKMGHAGGGTGERGRVLFGACSPVHNLTQGCVQER